MKVSSDANRFARVARALGLDLRSMLLLRLVDKGSQWVGPKRPGHQLVRYWIPKAYVEWLTTDEEPVLVGGSGDGSKLRALARRGLIEHQQNPSGLKYAYLVTASGIAAIAAARRVHAPGGG